MASLANIPIVINNRNRLTTTKKLIGQLEERGYNNIIIIDNDSSYPSLLDWYKQLNRAETPKVIILPENSGQLALYNTGLIWGFKEPWVVYTDSDIELSKGCEVGFIEEMVRVGEKYKYDKVGLSLEIGDVPINKYTERLVGIERDFWDHEVAPNIYKASVDTTFHVVKSHLAFEYRALRMGNIRGRHMPWYLNYDNLSEEEQYVIEHNDPHFSTICGEWLKFKE